MSIVNEFLKKLNEDIEEQPDLFDMNHSDIYNGDKTVQVRPTKDGNKQYIFDKKTSDYVDSLITDPADTSNAAMLLAKAYLNLDDEFESNDLNRILQNANKEDLLVFNTSSNGKIVIPVEDVFFNFGYLKREHNHFNQAPKEESNLTEKDDSDWMQKWQNNKARFESVSFMGDIKPLKGESVVNFAKRVQKVFNESIKTK